MGTMCNSCNPNLKNDPLEFDTMKPNIVSTKNPSTIQKADKENKFDIISNDNAYDLSVRAPSSYNSVAADSKREQDLENDLAQNKKQFELESGQ